jgi:hypothetical protein
VTNIVVPAWLILERLDAAGLPHGCGSGSDREAFCKKQPQGASVNRQVAVVLFLIAMVAIIIGVDLAFLRHLFWERLFVNIGIVLVFAAFYFIFLRHP